MNFAPLCDLSARAVLFPVRHHSPTAARLVRDLIARLRPAAVLVEGPADFNERIDELFLPHREEDGAGGQVAEGCEVHGSWSRAW